MMLESTEVLTAIEKIQQKKREEEEKAQRLADLRARIKDDASRVEEVVPEEFPEVEDAPVVSNAPEASNLYVGKGVYDARLLYEAMIRDYIEGYWDTPRFDIEGLVAVFDVRVNKEWKIVSSRIVRSVIHS